MVPLAHSELPAKGGGPPEAQMPASVYRGRPPRIGGVAGEGRPAGGAKPGERLQGPTYPYRCSARGGSPAVAALSSLTAL